MIARFEFDKFHGNILNGEDAKAKVGDGDSSRHNYKVITKVLITSKFSQAAKSL